MAKLYRVSFIHEGKVIADYASIDKTLTVQRKNLFTENGKIAWVEEAELDWQKVDDNEA